VETVVIDFQSYQKQCLSTLCTGLHNSKNRDNKINYINIQPLDTNNNEYDHPDATNNKIAVGRGCTSILQKNNTLYRPTQQQEQNKQDKLHQHSASGHQQHQI
jgi:hypothetical protein